VNNNFSKCTKVIKDAKMGVMVGQGVERELGVLFTELLYQLKTLLDLKSIY
jgi:hypothetical protein